MRDFLLFHLYGPMASWGDIAVGEVRPTHSHPGKSAIIGMIAAAMGIKRDEEDKHTQLNKSYGLAIRVDASGTILRDYHTTQVPPDVALKKRPASTRRDELEALDSYVKEGGKVGAILSTRDYYCDAINTVLLWAKENAPHSLNKLAESLANPEFTLYLGRKSCPASLPVNATVVSEKDIKSAFDKTPSTGAELLKPIPKNNTVFYYWEDINAGEAGMEPEHTNTRRDVIRSRIRWQFDNRQEHHASEKRVEEG